MKKSGGAALAGKTVKLQKSSNGVTWTSKYTLTTNSLGKASKKLKFTAKGTSYWRWYSPSNAQYNTASAKKTKLVVK